MSNKDYDAELRRLRKAGFEVTCTAGGHWAVRKDGVLLAVAPGSSTLTSGLRNFKAEMRRALRALTDKNRVTARSNERNQQHHGS